jgi:hypothetical protein
MRIHYSTYFIMSSLSTMDYPRKKSFLGKPGVPGPVLSAVVNEAAKASVAIGAGRPFIACQLLTQCFRGRDWDVQSGDDLFADIDPMSLIAEHEEDLPWEALTQDAVKNFGDRFITIRDLEKQEAFNVWLGRCTYALIYGLVHFEEAAMELESDRLRYSSGAQVMKRAGLDFPETPLHPNIESYFQWVEQPVLSFQAEHGQLPQPPLPLLKSKIVGARLAR